MLKYSPVKVIPKDLLSTFFDKDLFLNFKNVIVCFLRLILYIQILIYQNLDFLVKSAVVAGILLVSALMLFFSSKNSSFFWTTKKKTVTLKHLVALILWFLLQLKLILCIFLKKKELQEKKNKLISYFF